MSAKTVGRADNRCAAILVDRTVASVFTRDCAVVIGRKWLFMKVLSRRTASAWNHAVPLALVLSSGSSPVRWMRRRVKRVVSENGRWFMSRLLNSGFGVVVLLAAVSSTQADQGLASDRRSLDVVVQTSGHVWRTEQAGLSQNEFAVERVAAPVGLTAWLSRVASVRVSADVGSMYPMDLYADLRWPSSFQLRAGQFVMPLGFELMTSPGDEVIVNSSLLSGYAASAGSRDIGLMGGVQNARFSFYGAVVNGTGANTSDNNNMKDVCGRMAVRLPSELDGEFAVRAYYGWPNLSDSTWQTYAAEVRLSRGPLGLQIEAQSHRSSNLTNNTAYVLATWSAGHIQPAGRFDVVLPQGEHLEWMLTGGLNVEPISSHLKVMLDCTYRRSYESNWSILGFLFRLQAWL